MRARFAIVLLAVAGGALLGAAVTWWWGTVSGAPPIADAPPVPRDGSAAMPASPAATGDTSAAPAPRTAPDLSVPAAAVPAAVERDDGALFSERLQAFARAEVARGWRDVRADDVPAHVVEQVLRDYEHQLRTMAHAWGKAAGAVRDRDEAKERLFAGDDGVALLRAIDGAEPAAKRFVASDGFERLFGPRAGGVAVDADALVSGQELPDGATISFGAGVHAVPELRRGRDGFPRDVTLRGAGMDATLLVWSEQGPNGAIERLAVQDCTVFADGALTDTRSSPAVLSLRRVRVAGFDCGSGHAVAFYLNGGAALHGVDCRFEGGYGRHPGSHAHLVTAGGAFLARFDRCSFERMTLEYARSGTVRFVDCAMRDMLQPQPSSPSFHNCSYAMAPPERRDEASFRRDLNDLFPQWRERLRR
jgi:hypothetical protein